LFARPTTDNWRNKRGHPFAEIVPVLNHSEAILIWANITHSHISNHFDAISIGAYTLFSYSCVLAASALRWHIGHAARQCRLCALEMGGGPAVVGNTRHGGITGRRRPRSLGKGCCGAHPRANSLPRTSPSRRGGSSDSGNRCSSRYSRHKSDNTRMRYRGCAAAPGLRKPRKPLLSPVLWGVLPCLFPFRILLALCTDTVLV